MAQETAQPAPEAKEVRPEDKLVVVWTSGDRDVALKMVFMYTYNASASRFGWWDDITLVVWGPSAKLLSEDKELQEYIAKMKEAGITLEACKACADMYEASGKLTELGIDVKYMGDVLTNYVKEGRHVLTF
ncbi:MAG: DsrE family protein [bacterium]|nr:DsrE family protein [bacterium]